MFLFAVERKKIIHETVGGNTEERKRGSGIPMDVNIKEIGLPLFKNYPLTPIQELLTLSMTYISLKTDSPSNGLNLSVKVLA